MRCCCPTNLSNGAPSGAASSSARIVSSEIDFRNQGTVVLANGAQSVTDTEGRTLVLTVGNVAAAATFRFLAGTGLQFIANASNTVYNSGSQTASFLESTLANIFSTYGVDATWDWVVRLYLTVQTFPTINTTGALTLALRGVAGSPSNSAARMRGILRSNQVNVQVMRHATDAAGGQNYVLPNAAAPNTLPDVYGIRHAQGAMASFAGRWGGSFDDTPALFDVGDQPATSANTSGYRDSAMTFGLGFGTGNALSDVQVTVERMRFDWRASA